MMRSLGPRNLDELEAVIDARAEQIVAALLERPGFDGVHDFAAVLPVEIVARLVGLRREAAQLLRWGAATFNALGPANLRAARAVPAGVSMLISAQRLSEQDVRPGSWAASVFAAADRGEISRAEAKSMIIDFVTPSLDTTIFAASAMLHLLGTHPLVWDEIRAAPELIPGAVAEAVRLVSPLKAFTRLRDHRHRGGRRADPGRRPRTADLRLCQPGRDPFPRSRGVRRASQGWPAARLGASARMRARGWGWRNWSCGRC